MFPVLVILAILGTRINRANAVACYTHNGDDRNAQFGYNNLESYAPCQANGKHYHESEEQTSGLSRAKAQSG